MNACIDRLFIQDAVEGAALAYIGFVEGNGAAGDVFHTAQGFFRAIAKIIQCDDFVICLKKLQACVGSDIAGCTGDEYRFFYHGV
jgi:hypothetical protein